MLIEYNNIEVWYASDRRARSCLKLGVCNSKGRLLQHESSLEFLSRKCSCYIDKIESIELTTQTSNWPLHIVAVVILIAVMTARGQTLLITIPAISLAVLLALMLGNATKWIRVGYRDERGDLQHSWFADGSNFGWAGILGGTVKLYEQITEKMKPTEPAEIIDLSDDESERS